jgi:hypothetical protein
MVLQRHVAGQAQRLLSELFVFLLVLLKNLLRLGELLVAIFQLPPQSLVGFAKLPVFLSQPLGPRMLRAAGAKQISRRFVPRSLVLTDRFREKYSSLLRSFAWLSEKQTNTSARSSLSRQIPPKLPKSKHFQQPTPALSPTAMRQLCGESWVGEREENGRQL